MIIGECSESKHPIETYYKKNFPHIFSLVKYHILIGIFGTLVNLVCAFIWNYMDLFIILMSLSVSSKFQDINRVLLKAKGLVC